MVRVTGVTANLPVSDVEAARRFYADYLGLGVEEMNLGWVARYRTEGKDAVSTVGRSVVGRRAQPQLTPRSPAVRQPDMGIER